MTMFAVRFATVVAACLVVGLSAGCRTPAATDTPAAPAAPAATDASAFDDGLTLAQNVERFIQTFRPGKNGAGEHEKDTAPGIALMVRQGRKVLCQQLVGSANVDADQPITAQSPFYLASLSKSFTATAIMLLAHDHKLDLTDRLATHLPGIPKAWSEITIRHLLTHQSGIPDFLNETRLDVQGLTNEAVFARAVADGTLNFRPGTQFRYSNSGYVMLALVVEKASGQPFETFLRDRIFEPLGMRQTFVFTEGMTRDGVKGHSVQGSVIEYTLLTKGSGGIYSSLDDMSRWTGSFIDETLLPRQLHRMVSSDPARISDTSSYGYGWRIGQTGRHTVYSHTGSLIGFANMMFVVPDEKLSIVILSNGSFDASIAKLGRATLAYCLKHYAM
jgi:CubicO group peptidase (beta-lactamase class C family)